MKVFEEIYKRIMEVEEKKSSKKFAFSNIILFSTHFMPSIFKTSNNYSWEKYISFKFFILDNLTHYKCDHVNNHDTEKMMYFFSTAQKHMMALYRFKNVCLFKTKKYPMEQQDLQFNLLSETSPKYTIDIIQSGVKHQFSIFDLIRIINTSLSYEFNFFTDPKEIKNPWNNIPFTITNLYNIYFFLDFASRNTCIKMPILFSRFFQSKFCLEHFEEHNQLIIRKYIIENCHLFNNVKKLSHIYNMIEIFNSKRVKYRINIDVGFPESRLLEVMEPYLKLYLLANYSYEDDIMIRHKTILNDKLRLFHKNNQHFGRKIISLQLKKLYYISCLYYNDNILLFLPGNIYLPPPFLISLADRCYYIDTIKESNYKPVPDFENNNRKVLTPLNVVGILPIVRNFAFTPEQKIIIKEKYEIHIEVQIASTSSITETLPISIIDTNTDNVIDTSDENSEFIFPIINDELDFNELNNLIELLNLDEFQDDGEASNDDEESEYQDELEEDEEFVDDDSV
jgi:hypothetical protein